MSTASMHCSTWIYFASVEGNCDGEENGKCEQVCTDVSDGTHTCSCRRGYEVDEADGTACRGITASEGYPQQSQHFEPMLV